MFTLLLPSDPVSTFYPSLFPFLLFLPFLLPSATPRFRSTAAHTIAQFVVQSLSLVSPATPTSKTTPTPKILGAWMFICRQLYNTGEGLLVLERFQLHLHIAEAHKAVS